VAQAFIRAQLLLKPARELTSASCDAAPLLA
jgi:hypothetical protein